MSEVSPETAPRRNVTGVQDDAIVLWMQLWKQAGGPGIDSDALGKVGSYAWPGGAREMAEVVELVTRRSGGHCVTGADIPLLPLHPRIGCGVPADLPIDLPGLLRELEDAYIAHALRAAGGNKAAAAEMLGMGRTTLVEKLRRKAK